MIKHDARRLLVLAAENGGRLDDSDVGAEHGWACASSMPIGPPPTTIRC